MIHRDSHLSDEKLLLDIDGELSKNDEKRVKAHLNVCWNCRTRRTELEQAITEFVHIRAREFGKPMPSGDGPRALLKARLVELAGNSPRPGYLRFFAGRGIALSIATFLILTLGFELVRLRWDSVRTSRMATIVALPDSKLTPGATVLVNRGLVCAAPDTKNKTVPAAVRKQVFAEYGINADPENYEVDYLVTPALGGADDLHNLWPHSYAATEWNASVKDELEDRLRDMVCDGNLDLTAAQKEIATNWIAAYKKYFHTDKPLDRYCRKCFR